MIFGSTPGFVGYYGPTGGRAPVAVGFARGADSSKALTEAQKNATDIINKSAKDPNLGFLVSNYRIDWNRPVAVKYFFNSPKPAAITGYGDGQVVFQGMFGTYDGFQQIIGGDASKVDEFCSPLFCVISAVNGFRACKNDGSSELQKGCNIELYNLLLMGIQNTGEINEQGVLWQQANLTFKLGGYNVKASASMGNKVKL